MFNQWTCAECGKTQTTMNKCWICHTRFCGSECNRLAWKKTHKVECPLIRASYELALMICPKVKEENDVNGVIATSTPHSRLTRYGMISDATYIALRETIFAQPTQARERSNNHDHLGLTIDQYQKRFVMEAFLLTRGIQPISEPWSLLQADFLMANILNPPPDSPGRGLPRTKQEPNLGTRGLLALYFIDLLVHRQLCKLARIHLPLMQPPHHKIKFRSRFSEQLKPIRSLPSASYIRTYQEHSTAQSSYTPSTRVLRGPYTRSQ